MPPSQDFVDVVCGLKDEVFLAQLRCPQMGTAEFEDFMDVDSLDTIPDCRLPAVHWPIRDGDGAIISGVLPPQVRIFRSLKRSRPP